MERVLSWVFFLSVLSLSACSDDKGTTPPPEDTIAPAPVQDLVGTTAATGDSVTLTWTAPGDDEMEGLATRYDIRFSSDPIVSSNFDSARVLPNLPTPQSAGEAENWVIVGLPSGTWHFALKTADEVPNWSGISNSAVAVEADLEPPGRVTDLAVSSAAGTSMSLIWTAPGDDGGEGQASEYDLRYAVDNITEETWGDAVRAEGMSPPDSAGRVEAFTVSDLQPETTYYFALKTADEIPHWSELSNVTNETTPAFGFRRLTTSTRILGARAPDWSPDGQRIVFATDWVEQWHQLLYLIPAEGGLPVRLSGDSDDDFHPSWSPDGKQIVFVSEPEWGMNRRELWVIGSIPGSQATLLIHHPAEMNLAEPAWSPDGSRIAYVASTTQPSLSDIYLVSAAGGIPVRWTEEGPQNRKPTWSPDGTRIAFTSDRGGNFDIWVRHVDGGEAVQLTADPSWDGYPAWSPDGSQIAFSSSRSSAADVWIMSSTGEDPTQITFDPEGAAQPTWSPDGTRICFVASRDKISDLWVIDLEER